MSEDFANWIGRSETTEDIVTAQALEQFRATIESADGDNVDVAPPGFHWTLCQPTTVLSGLGEDGHPAKGGFLPPIPLPRRMWASSKMEFLAPIRKGNTIQRHSKIISITPKSGSTGELVFVDIHHVTQANGKDAVRETQTIVYREASDQPIPLPVEKSLDLVEYPDAISLIPDSRQLFRYSALTFNSHRIHYDSTYAQREEKYPALVVHGPLMATLLLNHAAKLANGKGIESFRFRGILPVFVDQPLHIAAERADTGLSLKIIRVDGKEATVAQVVLATAT